ncbi:hypothetical protein BH11PLA2_BH11PLA2_14190 [soil metagenome]
MRSLLILVCLSPFAVAQTTATFEDLTLAPNSYASTAPFSSGGIAFNNSSFSGGYWEGFSYSNLRDVTTAGYTNQYASYVVPLPANAGAQGTPNYAVGFDASAYGFSAPPTMTFSNGQRPASMMITNTTYAALSMLNGDSFAKKFGGVSGNDPDFLLLTITGYNSAGAVTGSIPFYLADYRFADNTQDYILRDWTLVNLSALPAGTVDVKFTMTSSDPDGFGGYNTPLYFAVDSIVVVPEPAGGLLILACFATFCRKLRKTGLFPNTL